MPLDFDAMNKELNRRGNRFRDPTAGISPVILVKRPVPQAGTYRRKEWTTLARLIFVIVAIVAFVMICLPATQIILSAK